MDNSLLNHFLGFTKFNGISLIPYERLEYKSNRSIEEINSVISEKIEIAPSLNSQIHSSSYKSYQGWVNNNGFDFISIYKQGTATINTTASGRYYENSKGLRINVVIKLQKRINIILLVLMFMVTIFGITNMNNTQPDDYLKESGVNTEELKEILGEEKYNELNNYKEPITETNYEFIIIELLFYIVIMCLYNFNSKQMKDDLDKMIQHY